MERLDRSTRLALHLAWHTHHMKLCCLGHWPWQYSVKLSRVWLTKATFFSLM